MILLMWINILKKAVFYNIFAFGMLFALQFMYQLIVYEIE